MIKYGKQLLKGSEGNRRGEISDRMAYTIALPVVVGLTGAIMNYMGTGQAPQELKDYFFPKTGKTKDDGNPERVALPSYMKDIFAYVERPLTTASHKIHPVVSAITQMLNNKDYFGYEITDAPLYSPKFYKDEANYLLKQFVPFSIANLGQRKQAGDNLAQQLSSFFGVVPASKREERTSLENKIFDTYEKRFGGLTKTTMEKEQKEAKQELRKAIKERGDVTGLSKQYVDKGILSEEQINNVEKNISVEPSLLTFKRLPEQDQLSIVKDMSKEEKIKYLPYMNTDVRKSIKGDIPAPILNQYDEKTFRKKPERKQKSNNYDFRMKY